MFRATLEITNDMVAASCKITCPNCISGRENLPEPYCKESLVGDTKVFRMKEDSNLELLVHDVDLGAVLLQQLRTVIRIQDHIDEICFE